MLFNVLTGMTRLALRGTQLAAKGSMSLVHAGANAQRRSQPVDFTAVAPSAPQLATLRAVQTAAVSAAHREQLAVSGLPPAWAEDPYRRPSSSVVSIRSVR